MLGGDDDGDDTDVGGLENNRKQFSSGKGMAHQRSNDNIYERKKALFGAGALANNQGTNSTGGLGKAQDDDGSRNTAGHLKSQENEGMMGGNDMAGIPSLT